MPLTRLNPDERKTILRAYRGMLKAVHFDLDEGDNLMIRRAFETALEAHKDMRRRSGEPYILHPIAVARIVAEEIGLGTTAVVCALLHDVVEDTELNLDDIDGLFGEKVAKIIDGLTKISGHFDSTTSLQAENFRKMLLTLSEDVRVILIKLADRLHNMRTMDAMPEDKQRKIASETLFLYAPLAHRLGLYNIKSELEDLGLKYTERQSYDEIAQKLRKTKAVRTRFINQFKVPIIRVLDEMGLKYEIKGRTKSIFSIWNKMISKEIPMEEVYDVFAIRIILDSAMESEKADCWKVYSVVTDFYKPNPDRLRDWISTPKANGYESLHSTVMSPTGKFVEVQIRTQRMDEIAEKGYAAHWKYKESASEHALDEWIGRIREMLESPESNALEFVDAFKMNLFADEIFVFTPKGELRTLPVSSTALDFAFDVHTDVGARCIGAKVNHKLVPLSHVLKSGDQVEVLTSRKQSPKEGWLKFVVTAKAKSKIKSALKEDKRQMAAEGKAILQRKLRTAKVEFNEGNLHKLMTYYRQPSVLDLYHKIGLEKLDLAKIKKLKVEKGKLDLRPSQRPKEKSLEQLVTNVRGKADLLVLGDSMDDIDYKLSPCCNPIPGDKVFGFVTVSEGIKIHRVSCPNSVQLMSNYAYRIVKAKWLNQDSIAFLAGIKVTGIDQVGLVNDVTKVISEEYHVNMRSLSFDTDDGTFIGTIMVFVNDVTHLTKLINKLRKVEGVQTVVRMDGN